MQKQLYILNILFLLSMWISKTLQPIFWNMQGKLWLFSASYVAMAVAGSLSLFYSTFINYIGLRKSLILGFSLYAVGLMLRAYPINIAIAILIGFIAGVGASVTGLTLKALLLELSVNIRQKVILHTNNINALTQSLGAVLSGFLVTLIAIFTTRCYEVALIFTGLICASSIFFVPHNLPTKKFLLINKKASLWYLFVNNKLFYTTLFVAFFINGICWAVIIPLIPIYLKTLHLDISTIGIVISAGIIIGLIIKNLYIYLFEHSNKRTALFIATFLTISSLYSSFIFLNYQSALLYSLTIIVFYAFKTLHSLLLSIIEVAMTAQHNAMLVLSLRQTAFLSGDIIGGIFMPFIYHNKLLMQYPAFFVFIIAIASIIIIYASKLSER